MTTLNDPDRRIIVSLGVGTGLLGFTLAALILLATVAIGALHFLPKPSAATNQKAFPRLQSEPLRVPREAIEAQNIGPLNRGALEETKTQAARLTLHNVMGLAALRFPTLALAAQMVVLPQSKPNKPEALDEVKGWQSSCPSCPNYRPPAGLYEIPRPPQLSPIAPYYYPTTAPQTNNTPPPSSRGAWIETARGRVWLPSGYAYEHDSGLLRNLATGVRSYPSAGLTAPVARVPKLPEQPPLADDRLGPALPFGPASPAVPDFSRAPRGDKKTGGYACANCKRPTVGDQWATQWTAEGTPISYLCRECWDKMSPEQRRDAYVEWYRRAVE